MTGGPGFTALMDDEFPRFDKYAESTRCEVPRCPDGRLHTLDPELVEWARKNPGGGAIGCLTCATYIFVPPEVGPTMQCPGCPMRLPATDLRAQVEHMEYAHPDLIRSRLEASGFRLIGDEWVDQLTDGSEE